MKRILIQIIILVLLAFTTDSQATDRFIDLGDGTICDSTSGLIWLKNASCLIPAPWDIAISNSNGLANGQCGLSDGSIAGNWKLPTTEELRIFPDAGYRYNTLNTAGFSNVTNIGAYWINSPYGYGNLLAGTIDMQNGFVDGDFKSKNHYIWPVRNRQLITATVFSAYEVLESPTNVGKSDITSHLVTNTGINPINLGQATITSSSGSVYSIISDDCSNTSLSPGKGCNLSLKLETTSPGTFTTRLSIPDGSSCAKTIAQPSVAAIATLSGTITNSSTGSGLAGANVTLSTSETTTTDANGNYIFNPAPTANTRSVTFSKTGYDSATTTNVTTSASVGAIVNTHLTPTGLFNILGTSFAPQQSIPFSGQVKITGGTGPYLHLQYSKWISTERACTEQQQRRSQRDSDGRGQLSHHRSRYRQRHQPDRTGRHY